MIKIYRIKLFFVFLFLIFLPIKASQQSVNADLINAVSTNDLEAVKAAVKNGADLTTVSRSGKQSLMIAVERGNNAIVTFLLDKGVPMDVPFGPSGTTPLMAAAGEGHEEIVKSLIDKGADVNKRRSDDKSALFVAITNDRKNIVETLLKNKKTEIDIQSVNGSSPLHEAVQRGMLDIVKVLIKKGANVHLKDDFGENALMIALQNNVPEIAEYLLSLPQIKLADINDVSLLSHRSPLDMAIYKRDVFKAGTPGYNAYKKVIALLETKGAKKTSEVTGIKPTITEDKPTSKTKEYSFPASTKQSDYYQTGSQEEFYQNEPSIPENMLEQPTEQYKMTPGEQYSTTPAYSQMPKEAEFAPKTSETKMGSEPTITRRSSKKMMR